MTQDELKAAYDRLDKVMLTMDRTPERGLTYFRQALLECRTKQDLISDIIVDVHRRMAFTQQTALTLRRLSRLEKMRDEDKVALEEVEADLLQLRLYLEAAKCRRDALRSAGMDIRLLVDVIKHQLRLGEIQPPPDERPADDPVAEDVDRLNKMLSSRAAVVIDGEEIIKPPNAAAVVVIDGREVANAVLYDSKGRQRFGPLPAAKVPEERAILETTPLAAAAVVEEELDIASLFKDA